ncbi:MAG TPA: hypothetical protein VHO95_10515 [Candidatus Dormibacteraeota bacterium]|nr:hypothetical protein [Candidatus Dormibacteraeota bacterium]
MDLYSIALFVHIVGALLLFAILTSEGIGLRFGFSTAQFGRVVGPVAALAIFIPGLYMMKAQWGFAGWVAVGITTYVLIAALSAYTGITFMRGRIDARTATLSWLLRVGMALGVVFDMTVKPDLFVSIAAVVVGAIAAVAAGLVSQRRVVTT